MEKLSGIPAGPMVKIQLQGWNAKISRISEFDSPVTSTTTRRLVAFQFPRATIIDSTATPPSVTGAVTCYVAADQITPAVMAIFTTMVTPVSSELALEGQGACDRTAQPYQLFIQSIASIDFVTNYP